MIDIGSNLTNQAFNNDLSDVLERAQAQGVSNIIVTGSCLSSSQAAKTLADKYPDILFSTAGLHPHQADHFSEETLAVFKNLIQHKNVVALGETGLDYNRNYSSHDNQLRSFEAHLELAKDTDKPIFLHERDAFSDFYQLMKNHSTLCNRSIVHCFTGNLEALSSYLELGLYIGITGWICDKKRGESLRKIIKHAPLNKLMIETDSPYLIPHKEKVSTKLSNKRRNEPWTLKYTAAVLAEALNVSTEEVITATTDNARKFFKLH